MRHSLMFQGFLGVMVFLFPRWANAVSCIGPERNAAFHAGFQERKAILDRLWAEQSFECTQIDRFAALRGTIADVADNADPLAICQTNGQRWVNWSYLEFKRIECSESCVREGGRYGHDVAAFYCGIEDLETFPDVPFGPPQVTESCKIGARKASQLSFQMAVQENCHERKMNRLYLKYLRTSGEL